MEDLSSYRKMSATIKNIFSNIVNVIDKMGSEGSQMKIVKASIKIIIETIIKAVVLAHLLPLYILYTKKNDMERAIKMESVYPIASMPLGKFGLSNDLMRFMSAAVISRIIPLTTSFGGLFAMIFVVIVVI